MKLDKSIFSSTIICLFGYQVLNHEIRSDPEDIKITKKDLGLFSYYSFSDRIFPIE